jgi:hypothetical protein
MQNIVFTTKSLPKFDLPNMISTCTGEGFFMEKWPKFSTFGGKEKSKGHICTISSSK